ncbi:uncharacterized protein [Ptychodera flava]|uniref:uncharacterized protein n=1 Tax=Ptychodera flava TaxID=63121 RepID=UPI00396AAF3C
MAPDKDVRLVILLLFLVVTQCVAQKYPVEIQRGPDSFEGLVEVNVQTGEEIFRTAYTVQEDGSEEKTGIDAPFTVRDVNKKLDALVDEENDVCYLTVYDANTEVSPVELKKAMERIASGEEKVSDTKIVTTKEMDVIEQPISDVASVSSIIGSHCADKTSYWTVTKNEETTCDGAPCDEDSDVVAEARDVGIKGCRWTWHWRLVFKRTCWKVGFLKICGNRWVNEFGFGLKCD